MIIKNALIYTPRHTFEEGSLTIRKGRIVPFAQPEEGEEIVDAKGAYALPGLVDIHFHGAMGKDFCDGNEEAIQTLADFEAGKGVLAICPATMTFSEEILNGVMDAAAAHQNGRGADLVGINMEGPFISPNKVGAQNPEYLHKADVAMFRRLQKRANGLIKLVDIAPEEPGALEFIAACHDEVRISIAHTCTSYDTANAAFDAGATHMTHLYNAMPGITHREPGPIIAALERGAEVELITDNVHIHPAMVRFTFMKRAVLEMNVPLESAVRAASENPAKSIGIDNDYGSLAAGRYGNVILADKELNIQAVYQKGTRIV